MKPRRRPGRGGDALRHPVARAIIRADLRSSGLDLQVRVLVLQDGEDARQWLADAACVLWHAFALLADTSARCRQLHGAVRTVIDLACRGARWDAAQALALDAALTLALEVIDEAMRTVPAADQYTLMRGHALRHSILSGTVTREMVPGAEIYAEVS